MGVCLIAATAPHHRHTSKAPQVQSVTPHAWVTRQGHTTGSHL
jgi:hypothetical protein